MKRRRQRRYEATSPYRRMSIASYIYIIAHAIGLIGVFIAAIDAVTPTPPEEILDFYISFIDHATYSILWLVFVEIVFAVTPLGRMLRRDFGL